MKNNLIKSFLVLILNFFFIFDVSANDFNFNISEIEIIENGNIYKGIKGGTVITNDGLKITSDNFTYNKSLNLLEAFGNVVINDTKKNYTMIANEVFYQKNIEKIFTEGNTKITVNNKYIIDGNNLYLYRNTMLLSSSNKAIINDVILNHIYNLNEFEYSINDELLKGKKVNLTINKDKISNPNSPKDKYFFDTAFIDLKNQKIFRFYLIKIPTIMKIMILDSKVYQDQEMNLIPI